MELLRIAATYPYLPIQVIDGFSSLIWTERYDSAGEFELKTYKIDETKALLPEGCLVTHFDTKVVMIVESTLVEKNKDTNERELTVTGRAAETFLNMRNYGVESLTTNVDASSRYQTVSRYPAEHLCLWIHDRVVRQIIPKTGTSSPRAIEEIIPKTSVSNSAPNDPGGMIKLAPDLGPLYDTLLKTANAYDLGIRTIRPTSYTPARLTFADGLLGTMTSTPISVDDTFRFDIYQGTDRRDTVHFDQESNTLIDLSHLRQARDYTNVAYLDNVPGWDNPDNTTLYLPGANSVVSGWGRRILYVSAQETIDKYGSMSSPVAMQSLKTKATDLLKKSAQIEYYDSEVPPDASLKYQQDYYLGDIVGIRLSDVNVVPVRITEYIRTHDMQGDRGFPTFVPV